ncbi:Extracellular membrane protein, CFEM domain protein [Beauveria brongniartii RCEF 3172]|uniref:Extracellular membrane protein, CFEM domain protein n=1 Tax=Beauveria brongniartii RCEF 3172 TaxID=1081107 RepID=A0A167DIY8_9HYPO|nr:Extracellular membrane protein, CFEM domain protein [Beauveria brongniartii RCEF 3172]
MKFTTAIIAVVATVAVASPFAAHNGTHGDLPKCASECLERIVKEKTNCKMDDYKCMCDKKTQAAVGKIAADCIFKSCNAGQAMKAKAVAEKTCKAVHKAAEAEARAKNTTIAQNTTIHARTFLVRNTTVHGLAALARNSTANRTLVSV